MKLIVGLGNPGCEYKNSRHNIGFNLVDRLAQRWSIDLTRKKHQAVFGSGPHGNEQIILLKPQTFMNLSGSSVASAVAFYQLPLTDVLVVVDDMDLELGRIRIRPHGSAGGHNGLKDIIARLGDDRFCRLRVGIGTAAHGNAVGHVLGRFTPAEQELMNETIVDALAAVQCWLDQGIDETMTRYNSRKR